VRLAAGGIRDGENVPFAGDSWSYQMHDCNGNGVPDELDLTSGTSQDCNHNNVPDECDPGRLIVSMGELTTLTLTQRVMLGSEPTPTGALRPTRSCGHARQFARSILDGGDPPYQRAAPASTRSA